jgi:hypothetical protein
LQKSYIWFRGQLKERKGYLTQRCEGRGILNQARRRPTSAAILSVFGNDIPAFPAFDVSRIAGGALKGIAPFFPITKMGNMLTLDFSAVSGKAVIVVIEMTR